MAAILAVLLMFGLASLFLWWTVFDPVSPIESVSESRFESPMPVKRNRALVISRVVCSSRDAWGEITAEFLAPPPPSAARSAAEQGHPVVEDMLRHTLTPVPFHAEEGCHRRRRAWAIPATLPPGIYRYISEVRFCNRIGRCVDVELPSPGEVIIGDEGWDSGRAREGMVPSPSPAGFSRLAER
jgi:hypothetical protein